MSLKTQLGGQGSVLPQPLSAGGGHVAGEGGHWPQADIDVSEASITAAAESI